MYIYPICSVLLAKLQVWDLSYCRAAVLLSTSHSTRVGGGARPARTGTRARYARRRKPCGGRTQGTSQRPSYSNWRRFGTKEPLVEINFPTIHRFFLVSSSVSSCDTLKLNCVQWKKYKRTTSWLAPLHSSCLSTKNASISEAPGWLSQLGVYLGLRSWPQGPLIEAPRGLPAQRECLLLPLPAAAPSSCPLPPAMLDLSHSPFCSFSLSFK